jgi:hypothetical protein
MASRFWGGEVAMTEAAWMTELINEARAISARTDATIRDRRSFDQRWLRYKARLAEKERAEKEQRTRIKWPAPRELAASRQVISEWRVDDSGNSFRFNRGI